MAKVNIDQLDNVPQELMLTRRYRTREAVEAIAEPI